MIPLTIPALGAEEIAACERVLRSGMLVQGKEVLAFEAELARVGRRAYAVAVVNGTAALELALEALAIGPGDEVLCPALTWPSPAHAVRRVGATPVLVDVDPREWNATEQHFAEARSPRTRAAIVIEQFGNPARHDRIAQALPGLPLIVDAACSLGSSYRDAPCGSHGIIACTSFHPRKVLTTGEGGACLTDDGALAQRLRVLRNHGQLEPGNFVTAAGNERMTELAAAIGQVQLAKLNRLCDERRRLVAELRAQLPTLVLQEAPEGGRENRQTLGVLVGEPFAGSAARDRALPEFAARGVQAGKLSYALHTLPQFTAEAERAKQDGRTLEVAQDIAARGLCLPLFPGMRAEQLELVIQAIKDVIG
ncbi:MAG: DegT/DnrJ/EryC1/StrS family aminotransferase [Myxococcales bacterium]